MLLPKWCIFKFMYNSPRSTSPEPRANGRVSRGTQTATCICREPHFISVTGKALSVYISTEAVLKCLQLIDVLTKRLKAYTTHPGSWSYLFNLPYQVDSSHYFNALSLPTPTPSISFSFYCCSSGLISALLVLSTIYLFMKVSFSPDIIFCG